tara:strand:- start:39 stop:473 length:435 start_codon:yes stop_codon:yes gene_type:complete
MNKLITELTESISCKLKDIERITKMINLVSVCDVKGTRKFIYDNDTYDKEMFYDYLQWGDPELFAKVYPKAESQKGKYVIEIIHEQYKDDYDYEKGHAIELDGYPDDYSDEEYPDDITKSGKYIQYNEVHDIYGDGKDDYEFRG